jgi:hypothetical protein
MRFNNILILTIFLGLFAANSLVSSDTAPKKSSWAYKMDEGRVLFNKLMTNTRKNPKLKKSYVDKNEECECSAWNSCPGKDCSVSQLCPLDFSLFKIVHHRKYPLRENIFTLNNLRNKTYSKNELRGMAWGQAQGYQALSNLMIFDPYQVTDYSKENEKLTRRYSELITKVIAENDAKVIPEFNDLYEFSSHPSFKNLFYKKVERYWVEKALNLLEITNYKKPLQDVNEILNYKWVPTVVVAAGFDVDGNRQIIIPLFKVNKNGSDYTCYRNLAEHVGVNVKCVESNKFNSQIKTQYMSYYSFQENLGFQARNLQLLCEEHYGNDPLITKIEITQTDLIEEVIATSMIGATDEDIFAILKKAYTGEYGRYSEELALLAFSQLQTVDRDQFRELFGLTPFSYLMKVDARLKLNQPYGFLDKEQTKAKYKYSWKDDVHFRKKVKLDLLETNLVLKNEITNYYPLIPKIEFNKKSIDMVYGLIKREANSVETTDYLKDLSFSKEPAYLKQKLYITYKEQLKAKMPSSSISHILGILAQKTPSHKISDKEQKIILKGCEDYERTCTYISLELLKGIIITKSKVDDKILLNMLRKIEESYVCLRDLKHFYDKNHERVPKKIKEQLLKIL